MSRPLTRSRMPDLACKMTREGRAAKQDPCRTHQRVAGLMELMETCPAAFVGMRYIKSGAVQISAGPHFQQRVLVQLARPLHGLQGRATVEMKVNLKEARNEGVKGGIIRMVADGFNAPVTAGNFVDLVSKKFYDNMEVQRADGFIVQTGNPGNEVRPRLTRRGEGLSCSLHATLAASGMLGRPPAGYAEQSALVCRTSARQGAAA